jgi:predicted HD phosphohydrolase
VGEQADDRYEALMRQYQRSPYLEQVQALQSRRREADEIVRHDVIYQPLPDADGDAKPAPASQKEESFLMLTERFDEAFRYAHQLHRTQERKGTSVPYISHLMSVAALVVEHGGNEDQVIAALLHDAAEDQGGAPTLAEIRTRFGNSVAAIVSDCTDAWTEPKPPW